MQDMEPRRGCRRFVLPLVLVLGLLALVVASFWYKGRLHPLIERIQGEVPQAKVAAYLEAVRQGDTNAALTRWPLAGASLELEARRRRVTAALLALGPGLRYRVLGGEWWSTCCEPSPVRDPADAGLARLHLEITGAEGSHLEYIFDVAVPGGYWGAAADYPLRRWLLRDVYPAGERPLYFPWPRIEPTA